MGVIDELIEAREAYERREWVAAYHALSDLDAGDLRAEDFDALAVTAHLLGRRNDCVQALQRAFQANLVAGNELAAVRSASWLALVLTMGGEPAVGGGWADRAERILDGVDGDVAERGYALIVPAFRHISDGDIPAAIDAAARIVDYGRRFGEADLVANGLMLQGRLITMTGRVPDGLRLMDEAMVGVVAGEVSPIMSGMVYCAMVEGCGWVSDHGRVVQWTRALGRWCDAQPGLVAFTGQCAVHRGQVMKLHGAFTDALDELALAAERYAVAGGDPAVGISHQERGDVLRIMGDYDAAELAYEEAAKHGNESQPGRSLLRLARGETLGAATSIRRVLDEIEGPVMRSQLLPGAIEILVAAGDLDRASACTDELAEIAGSFGSPALDAAAGYAVAQVSLARDDPATAVAAVRPAIDAWNQLSAPHEVARCRMVLGQALRRLGDEHSATSELAAARDVFAELGARPATREAERLLDADQVPGGLSPREIEVLRLVAAGRTNAEIAEELFVAEKTVARHLSNIFTKLGVGSRTAAAAFAFERGLL